MDTFRLRWRFFWSRRSPGRTMAALLLALAALLASVYLALPADARLRVATIWAGTVTDIGALGLDTELGAGAILFTLLSVALFILPAYRQRTYLATSPSSIPPVTVYLDAENQLLEGSIRPFMTILLEHLDGRRADLLYFLDASMTATNAKYKSLYRFGFRPIDVPHNPTGKAVVKEAVDKEIAMHAIERALTGPSEQEFIIITGDQDFVHLVYRLVALGHNVHIWASPIRGAYRTLASYLNIGLLDLTQFVSEREIERQTNKPPRASSTPRSSGIEPAPGVTLGAESDFAAESAGENVLDLSGERAFYRAIDATLKAWEACKPGKKGISRENTKFRGELSGRYAPHLAQVGYSAGKWIDYWIDRLIAVKILHADADNEMLLRGTATLHEAAKCMFAMTAAAANAAAQIALTTNEQLVRMPDVASTLIATTDNNDAGNIASQLHLLDSMGTRPSIHARYFVRGARSLGLINFADVGTTLETITVVA